MGVDTEQAFNVTSANQSITAVIDGVTNTVKLTLGQYNIDTFTAELQTQLNRMADSNGKTINNIVVGFDSAKTALTVTGATTSSKSFIRVTWKPRLGSDGCAGRFWIEFYIRKNRHRYSGW